MSTRPWHSSPSPDSSGASGDDFSRELASFLACEPGADDRLVRVLEKPVRDAAKAFLGHDNEDVHDVVQETCLAVLKYIRQQEGFQGNLIRFAVTISRNRCRNLLNWNRRWQKTPIDSLQDWIEHPEQSPLDLLADEEIGQILRDTVSKLAHPCDILLRGFFLLGRSAESLRKELGVKSVQGIYYRRDKCLHLAHKAMKKRLSVCSSGRKKR